MMRLLRFLDPRPHFILQPTDPEEVWILEKLMRLDDWQQWGVHGVRVVKKIKKPFDCYGVPGAGVVIVKPPFENDWNIDATFHGCGIDGVTIVTELPDCDWDIEARGCFLTKEENEKAIQQFLRTLERLWHHTAETSNNARTNAGAEFTLPQLANLIGTR